MALFEHSAQSLAPCASARVLLLALLLLRPQAQ